MTTSQSVESFTGCFPTSNMRSRLPTAHSVADALEAIEQKSFDVYVLDYKLPDGSGLDVAERIRSKWGATPIILISGYDPSAVALRAEKLCVSDFLEKPSRGRKSVTQLRRQSALRSRHRNYPGPMRRSLRWRPNAPTPDFGV